MGSDAGAHSSTACPSDDDSDGSESSGSDLGLRLDPVLSVPVPSREADVPAAHFAHLHRAQQVAPSLLAPPPALPSLTATARRMASLGPQRLLEHRDAAYRRFVAKAEELRAESASLLRGASADVLRVLRAASPLGPHPALLQWCLSEVGWHDTSLIQDILRALPRSSADPAFILMSFVAVHLLFDAEPWPNIQDLLMQTWTELSSTKPLRRSGFNA